MVPQHAHASSRLQSSARFSRPHPDPVRIVGISGTLVLNVVALLLLLVPVSQGTLVPADGPPIPIRWIEDAPPPPPPPPVKAEVVQPRPVPPVQRQPVVEPRPAPAAIEPVVIAQGELAAPPVIESQPGATAGAGIEPGPVQSGMHLEYAHATPPPYPGAAIRGNLQGTVLLEVLVGVDGRPIEVHIHGSSGHRVLDAAARRHVLREWSFRPAMQGGQAVQAIGIVPIDFHLDRS